MGMIFGYNDIYSDQGVITWVWVITNNSQKPLAEHLNKG